MPISARVFSLFLAGASDVADEQAIVRQLVDSWNREHGFSRNAFITVTSWLTHTYPAAGAEPQQVINRQVLDSADIVVAVLWTRFGTPTSQAMSGTEEEIERSIAAKKRVMVYFSDRPIHPSDIDSGQYAQIREFADRFRKRGLYSSYGDLESFREHFRTHLALLMNDLCAAQPGTPEVTKEAPIALSMTPTYWVVVLGALETQVQAALRTGAELRSRNVKVEDIPDAERTALTAPVLIRSFLVDLLVKHGVLKPEVSEAMGYKALMATLQQGPLKNSE